MMIPLPPLRRALAALLLGLATTAVAAPTPSLVPGGVALIELGSAQQARPSARLGDKAVLVQREGTNWVAWVGMPLDLEPGAHALTVTQAGKTRSLPITIKGKAYPVQHLKIKNRNMVEPDAETLRRIEREAATQNEVKTLFREAERVELDFITPVDGRRSSAFGLRRTFNGQPRAPHRGLDIAAPTGTPAKAPAAGVVTHVGNFFFNGKTVFIDHGQGLISMFCHLDKVDVAAGSRIARGARVGAVGTTGRSTGPHLHWSVFMNGTPVDPALFLR